MLDKLTPTQRLVIFFAVAIVFFALYDRYYVQPKVQAQQALIAEEQAAQTAQTGQMAGEGEAVFDPSVQAPATAAITSTAPIAQGAKTPPQSAQSGGVNALATVQTAISSLEIDELGRIRAVTLNDKIFDSEDEAKLSLFDPTKTRPLEIRFADRATNDAAFKTPYSASNAVINAQNEPQTLTLTQQLDQLTVTKTIIFYPDGHYDLRVALSEPTDFFITNGFRPVAASDPMTVQGSLTQTAIGTVETIAEGDAKGNEVFAGAKMVSSFDRYYATIFFNYEKPFDVYFNKIDDNAPLGFVRSNGDISLGGYIGPKYVDRLRAINPELTSAVEYGFFTFLSKPLFVVLEWIYSVVPNWGFAIVIFTLLVKLVLFPLSHKGMVSMAKLKELTPKMKELQEKYKDDKQKLQVHMMELYKKHGANPLGGCLPMLLQIPIFFAIYRLLLNAIELKGASWLYIGDLSLRDPFFALPILMGITMYFQQRITPSNFTDPMQEKLFKVLPIIFTAFFLFFPSGLVLYWLVNNLVSIAQQWFVNRHIAAQKLKHSKEVK